MGRLGTTRNSNGPGRPEIQTIRAFSGLGRAGRPECTPIIQGSGTFPWGSRPTVTTLECIVSSGHVAAMEPPTWRGRELFTV
jgi:hypothetical protein